MSTAEQDRRLRRRAALKSALLKGDVLGAARAWDRLRVSGAAIRPEEAEAARAARSAVGHALRDARYRRQHADDRFGFHYPDAVPARRGLPLPASRTGIQILSGIGLIALLVVLFYFPPALPGGLPAAPAAQQPSAAPTALAGGGRGRTSATAAPVVVVQPTAVPTPATPAPPLASPAAGTGAGTGTNLGTIPAKPAGDDRFVFQVLDARSLRPVSGVCVTYGNECGSDARRTNDQGLWWIDFPRSSALAKVWRFEFWMPGYLSEARQLPYVPGQAHETVEILLRRAQ